MNKLLTISIFGCLTWVLAGCNRTSELTMQTAPAGKSITLGMQGQREYDLICNALRSIPAPVEAAAVLKHRDRKFRSQLLNSPQKTSFYVSGASKALNLGVYGADMAYCNLYNATYQSLKYLEATRRLSQELQVDDQVDFKVLNHLISSAGNLDSLMSLMNLSFMGISNRMQDRGQVSLSLMMITGGWIEGLYLLTQTAKQSGDLALAEKVGEQQVVLGQLMALLNQMQQDSDHQEVFQALRSLQDAYANVQITHTFTGESEIVDRDGVATFVDKRRTHISISKAQVNGIAQAAAEAHKMLTNKLVKT